MNKLAMTAKHSAQASIARIGQWFPHVLTEKLADNGKIKQAIDFDLLKQELSDVIVDGAMERYQFNWPGKKQALLQASLPTSSTLRPDKAGSVDWAKTRNLYIEGDNLEALKLLQHSYWNRIKLIYIDPPYNTGKQYVFNDQFFHSEWLSMMYARLKLARQLLREDGVMFISIDDHEQANLQKLLEELFGPSNFVAHIVWQKKYAPANDAKTVSATHEHILMFAKNIEAWQPGLLPRGEKQLAAFRNPDDDPRGPWRASDLSARTYSPRGDYPIIGPTGERFYPPPGRAWIVSEQRYKELLADGRITFGRNGTGRPMQKRFLSEVKAGITPDTWWSREKVGDNKSARYELKELMPENVFDTPKPSTLITYMMNIANVGPDDMVLDFFSGSATTAHAVMRFNAEDDGRRAYIMVQLPEQIKPQSHAWQAGFHTICDIGKERIRRAALKIKADTGADIDYGYRLLRVAAIEKKEAGSQDELPEELLIQMLLELGLELSLSIEESELHGKRLYYVAGGLFIACFAKHLPQKLIEHIIMKQPQLAVFREHAFIDADERAYVEAMFKSRAAVTRLIVL